MTQTKYTNIKFMVETLQSTDVFKTIIEYLIANYGLTPTLLSSREVFNDALSDTLFLTYLNDEEIKTFFQRRT